MTPWERKLWYEFFRNYPIRFQRQKAIGNFIVDFYCHKAKLVIEIDGYDHFTPEGRQHDQLRSNQLYKKYGYYKESQIAIVLEGADGAEKIKNMMEEIRNNPPKAIGKYKTLKFRDYSNGKVKDCNTEEIHIEDLPKSNVLYFELENDFWCCARPSGTEPKIKVVGDITDNRSELQEVYDNREYL